MSDPLRYQTVDGAKVLTHQTAEETLFCVAYETPSKGDFLYVHARNANDAYSRVLRSRFKGITKIVGIAPAVGNLEEIQKSIRIFT